MKLDVGSGRSKRAGYETVDNDPLVNPDHLTDIEEELPFPDNSVDEIRAYAVLEHLDTRNKVKVMAEFWRVLKVGGILDIRVPIAGTPQSFQDPTHISFWNRNSFWYFTLGNPFYEAFRKRYSKYPVPGFKVLESSEIDYRFAIKLQK